MNIAAVAKKTYYTQYGTSCSKNTYNAGRPATGMVPRWGCGQYSALVLYKSYSSKAYKYDISGNPTEVSIYATWGVRSYGGCSFVFNQYIDNGAGEHVVCNGFNKTTCGRGYSANQTAIPGGYYCSASGYTCSSV